jgi:hypothetical protein
MKRSSLPKVTKFNHKKYEIDPNPSLIVASTGGAPDGKLLALSANIRLWLKPLIGTNTLTYCRIE